MIIKTLSRKSGTGQLLEYVMRYILDDNKQLIAQDLKQSQSSGKPFLIKFNLRSKTIEGFVKEFNKNEQNRIHKRSNQNTIEHTILSWAKEDTTYLTDKALKDMARQYIRLRGENNLYLGSKHLDKDHVHIHLCMSATQLNGMSSRISKYEFAQLKVNLQEYQKTHYPQLVSLPHHGLSKEQKAKPQHEIVYREKYRMTRKEGVRQALNQAYTKADSQQAFLDALAEQDYEPYYRGGKLTGVKLKSGENFRLKTFGYDKTTLAELDLLKEEATEHILEKETPAEIDRMAHLNDLLKEQEQEQELTDLMSQVSEMHEQDEFDEMEELQSIRKRGQNRDMGRSLGGGFMRGGNDNDDWDEEMD